MKEYLRKNGIRMGIIVFAVALLIGVGRVTRAGQISLFQNVTGIVKAPMQKVLSSVVNWMDTMYGFIFEYDSLVAENESLRSQLADAQQSARDGIEASEENVRLRRLGTCGSSTRTTNWNPARSSSGPPPTGPAPLPSVRAPAAALSWGTR